MCLWEIVSTSEDWALTQRAYVNACLIKAKVMLSPQSVPRQAEAEHFPLSTLSMGSSPTVGTADLAA